MTISTVHGRVLSRPGDGPTGDTLLESRAFAANSLTDVFFGAYQKRYSRYEIRMWGIEKPGANSTFPLIVVSTNGATFESGAAYDTSLTHYTSTTALVATGATGQTSHTFLGLNMPNWATASGRMHGYGIIDAFTEATGNTDVFLKFEWNFLNSASHPATVAGRGWYASGPFEGVRVQWNAGDTVQFGVDIYGIGAVVR